MFSRLPGARWMSNLSIGAKLNLGFGILVVLTLLMVGLNFFAGAGAINRINLTGAVRVPSALAASQTESALLQLLGDVRGYLFLGDSLSLQAYETALQNFEADLANLESELRGEQASDLAALKANYEQWKPLARQLIALRDDQLAREPAYNLLVTEGARVAGTSLLAVDELIRSLSTLPPTTDNTNLLRDTARYQGTFAAMFSAARGYVTTRNRIYLQEYESNLRQNTQLWNDLTRRSGLLTDNQRNVLTRIETSRAAFLTQIAEQVFPVLQGERWREDLYLFRTEAVPLITDMQTALRQITSAQQASLQTDLDTGRNQLEAARNQTLVVGILALLFGLLQAFVFRENIAGPVGRLTSVAERIQQGNLEAQAHLESGDEIGTLADTFNRMTGQLRQTLTQVREEKKRADDLLNVVIPIGVDLASERDFNRLLQKMLLEAKQFCRANTGLIYLLTEDQHLRAVIVRDDERGLALGGTTGKEVPLPLFPAHPDRANQRLAAVFAAVRGATVNVAQAQTQTDFDLAPLEATDGSFALDSTSSLSIPLRNSAQRVIGVLQLLDAHHPETRTIIPFDANLQEMMESFSSLAVAALEAYIREQRLRQEIQQLRIEIDEARRQKEVSEIVESESFRDLQAKAREMRARRQNRGGSESLAGAD